VSSFIAVLEVVTRVKCVCDKIVTENLKKR